MSNKNCKTCLYDNICKSSTPCTHYTPADNEMTDAELEEYIENARREYRSDWWRYIDEDAE